MLMASGPNPNPTPPLPLSNEALPIPCHALIARSFHSALSNRHFLLTSFAAMEHSSVNLGQGFPDAEGPTSMKEIASSAMYDFHNQYPSLLGLPELRQAVARHSETNQVGASWRSEGKFQERLARYAMEERQPHGEFTAAECDH